MFLNFGIACDLEVGVGDIGWIWIRNDDCWKLSSGGCSCSSENEGCCTELAADGMNVFLGLQNWVYDLLDLMVHRLEDWLMIGTSSFLLKLPRCLDNFCCS